MPNNLNLNALSNFINLNSQKNDFSEKQRFLKLTNEGYTESFSYQWSKFSTTQLDTRSGRNHSQTRLLNNTRWKPEELKGKLVLECGAGPGRFTEIFARYGARVVAVDMSEAIKFNYRNNKYFKNCFFVQGDIFELPQFLLSKFDFVFCYGVLQHTPNPYACFQKLIRYSKPGGKISIDIYRKRYIPTAWTTPKYLWRPITTKLKKQILMKTIEWYVPKYITFDTLIKKIPKIGSVLGGLIPIPCWNYLNSNYTKNERIQHCILDTFDALSPKYDYPMTTGEIVQWGQLNRKKFKNWEVFNGSNGVVLNASLNDQIVE